MLVLLSFVSGVGAMYLYRRFYPEPIFRQDVADLTIKELVDQYMEGESAEDRAAREPAMVKNFSYIIGAYSHMRENLR
jgi:hypothetical protein